MSKKEVSSIEQAQQAAQVAEAKAIDAEQKVEEANKSPEQLAADKARKEADDARAKAQELVDAESEAAKVPMTVAEAAVLVVAPPEMSAGDFRAQKFGNDPENPKPAPGIDPNGAKVMLSRKTPDKPDGLVYTEVPKEMVGDYERAGLEPGLIVPNLTREQRAARNAAANDAVRPLVTSGCVWMVRDDQRTEVHQNSVAIMQGLGWRVEVTAAEPAKAQ